MSIEKTKITFLKQAGINNTPAGTTTGTIEDTILEYEEGAATTSYLVKAEVGGTVHVIKPRQIIDMP